MSVTQQRFEQGLTYDAYKAQMTRNQDRLIANEQTISLDAEHVAFFRQLPQPLNVLVIAEDWCGDVIANLPVLGKLAEESGKLNLRVFLRDQNLDLMNLYLKEGKFQSIPVFAFFDADFTPLGHWIERPARISELQAEMRRSLFASDPLLAGVAPDTPFGQLSEEARARLSLAYADFRQQHRRFADNEVVREVRAILEAGAAQQPEATPAASRPALDRNGSSNSHSAPNRQQQAKVSITYCAACGYEPQTLELTGALMRTFVHDLAAIELIPWQDGAFDVVVNGDLIHSMYRDGSFPEHETIICAVRERLR